MLALFVVFLLGALAASLANAAVYEWAYDRRRLSPWQPTPDGVADRTWLDRVPLLGWLRLRRDADRLGRGFWVRPMLVEIGFAAAMAALYAWEIGGGLVEAQLGSLGVTANAGGSLAMFAAHFALAWLMLVASLIDIDEKTIPDEVTVPGTLVGLTLLTLLPMAALPNVEERLARPRVGVEVRDTRGRPVAGPNDVDVYVEPTHLAAPNGWPKSLVGGPQNHSALAIGLGCYTLWCVALTNRHVRTRRGLWFGLGVMLRRVGRELRSRPLREILLGGLLAIACVWFTGGGVWQGLLSALVGAVVSGSMVWAVRIVGSAALGKEAMGFGDVTLMFMVGAFLGWQAGLLVFFLAPFAGLVIGVLQLVLRRDDVIPYGPFLCLGAALVVVRWGDLWTRTEALFALGTVLPVVLVVCLGVLGVLLAVWRQFKLRVLGVSEDWGEEG